VEGRELFPSLPSRQWYKKKCGKKKEKNLNGKRKMAVKKKDFHRGKKRKTNNPARPPTTEAYSKEVLPPLNRKRQNKKTPGT
jgi:hypothetical protein